MKYFAVIFEAAKFRGSSRSAGEHVEFIFKSFRTLARIALSKSR